MKFVLCSLHNHKLSKLKYSGWNVVSPIDNWFFRLYVWECFFYLHSFCNAGHNVRITDGSVLGFSVARWVQTIEIYEILTLYLFFIRVRIWIERNFLWDNMRKTNKRWNNGLLSEKKMCLLIHYFAYNILDPSNGWPRNSTDSFHPLNFCVYVTLWNG